jgi:hypothetical protein
MAATARIKAVVHSPFQGLPGDQHCHQHGVSSCEGDHDKQFSLIGPSLSAGFSLFSASSMR